MIGWEENRAMTRDEMYRLLTEKKEKTNWNSREEIRAYNEYARELRQLVYADEETECRK